MKISEVESRTLGSRPRTQKEIRSQGQPFQGQTISRPRTGMFEAKATDSGASSSIRRILKRGGGRNFRKFEKNKDQNKKLVHPSSVRFFCPKSGEEQKQKEKKGLHSDLVRFFAQSWVQAYNKRIKHTLGEIQARSQKFAMGGLFRGSGGGAPALENFAFFCKINFILGLF